MPVFERGRISEFPDINGKKQAVLLLLFAPLPGKY